MAGPEQLFCVASLESTYIFFGLNKSPPNDFPSRVRRGRWMTQPGNQWSIALRLIQWHLRATLCVCPDPPLIPSDQNACTPWFWSCGTGPWASLDVAEDQADLTWWHSCLGGKENKAGKMNRAGIFRGGILLPLVFFLMCWILHWGRKNNS